METRFLRTAPTMAYPEGRLLAQRGGVTYVLAVDGWTRVAARPGAAVRVSREDAEDWCDREGWGLDQLDLVP